MNVASQSPLTPFGVPEKREIRVGFLPLTDCASVAVAANRGFDEQYGIRIVPSKESSWASLRDKLVNGDLDVAHVLYGMVLGIQLVIGGPRKDMAVLMTLNRNGQGITLSERLRDEGIVDGSSLARAVAAGKRKYSFAQTFPTGTHAMWLYYWLASHGINPITDVRTVTVPPSKMAECMRSGAIDGCCVGEPWNQRALIDGVGFSVASSQDIWPDHPEKVLGTTEQWADTHPNAARALVAAMLEASRWLDATAENRRQAAEIIVAPEYVGTDVKVILARLLGRYEDGLGRTWDDAHPVRFFDEGAVNFPYLSDAMWFLTQQRRWGLLDDDPDYLAVARAVNRIDIYRAAAERVGIRLPDSPLRSSVLFDGVRWDGSDPQNYACSFPVQACRSLV